MSTLLSTLARRPRVAAHPPVEPLRGRSASTDCRAVARPRHRPERPACGHVGRQARRRKGRHQNFSDFFARNIKLVFVLDSTSETFVQILSLDFDAASTDCRDTATNLPEGPFQAHSEVTHG